MRKIYDQATAELAMTLSTLAYVEENRIATREQMIDEINAGLEQAGYRSWQVAWGPGLNPDRSNMMFAARDSETGHIAVSVRGSDFSFWLNWIEDLATLTLVPYDEFVADVDKSAQVARGTAIGLRQLLGMQDEALSLQAFLAAAPAGTPILLTGHSLGGCLAAGLAPCVAQWIGGPSHVSVYTMAAPSPGNAAFAAYYDTLFTHRSGASSAFRFFNSLDVVPNAWASLSTIETYYPPLLDCPDDIKTIVTYAEQAVGRSYRQLGDASAGSAIELTGTLILPFARHRGRLGVDPFEDALFLWEAGQQHACTTYQTLLHTPLTVPEVAMMNRALVAARKPGRSVEPLNPQ